MADTATTMQTRVSSLLQWSCRFCSITFSFSFEISEDGYDETLVPLDYEQAGQIRDMTCLPPWLEKCLREYSSRASWTAATLDHCWICPFSLRRTVNIIRWRLTENSILVHSLQWRSNGLAKALQMQLFLKQWPNAVHAPSCNRDTRLHVKCFFCERVIE